VKITWLGAVALVLSSQPVPHVKVQSKQEMDAAAHRFTQIASRLAERQLSREDRSYVIKMFSGRYGFQRLMAFMCLQGEVDEGLISADQLMSLVEGQLEFMPGPDAATCFLCTTEYFCGLRGSWSASFRKDIHRAEGV